MPFATTFTPTASTRFRGEKSRVRSRGLLKWRRWQMTLRPPLFLQKTKPTCSGQQLYTTRGVYQRREEEARSGESIGLSLSLSLHRIVQACMYEGRDGGEGRKLHPSNAMNAVLLRRSISSCVDLRTPVYHTCFFTKLSSFSVSLLSPPFRATDPSFSFPLCSGALPPSCLG